MAQEKNSKKFKQLLWEYHKTEEGKFVLDCLMEMTGVFDVPHEKESVEFFLGRRHIGIYIHNVCNREKE